MSVHQGRFTARLDGDFVVFLLGVRLNRPWLVHRWVPIFTDFGKMARELARHPELGLLGERYAFDGGGPLIVQYWRSFGHLEAYARMADSEHLPAWRRFNRRVRASEDVGIWHETYRVAAGEYEGMYVNLPRAGLARAGEHVAVGSTSTAATRIGDRADDTAPVPGY